MVMATIPLSQAAQRLGLSWAQTWRLVLIGRLEGVKDKGRWKVQSHSVALFEQDAVSKAQGPAHRKAPANRSASQRDTPRHGSRARNDP